MFAFPTIHIRGSGLPVTPALRDRTPDQRIPAELAVAALAPECLPLIHLVFSSYLLLLLWPLCESGLRVYKGYQAYAKLGWRGNWRNIVPL